MDTLGSLVDKLATVNNKMFFNQEFLYEIRRMSEQEFVDRCLDTSGHFPGDGSDKFIRELYTKLCKVVDLNLQRQSLILEFDRHLVNMVMDISSNGEGVTDKYVFDQHKTLKTEE